MGRLTYKKAGVDIQKAGAFKHKIKALVRTSFTDSVLKDIGGFGSLVSLDAKKYKQPVLVSSTDGVGTKLKIAILVNKHDTVGVDLVGMNVNDILCTGALPLFFLDYIATGRLTPDVLYDIVKGINNGCIESGCALVGGETAEMPGMYREGEYDLAGFCVGIVEKNRIIDGSKIEPGNVIIGLESNGIHSNGYSLVRKVFSEAEQRRMASELLRPTRIYVKPVLGLLRNAHCIKHNTIRGIAHITGGAFYDKIVRILPDNVTVRLYKNSWQVPKVFQLMQNKANIEDREMYHTFNMGIGMVIISHKSGAEEIMADLAKSGIRSWIIGDAISGKKEVEVI